MHGGMGVTPHHARFGFDLPHGGGLLLHRAPHVPVQVEQLDHASVARVGHLPLRVARHLGESGADRNRRHKRDG